MTATAARPEARLRLFSRPGCHLCEAMRRQVDGILRGSPHEWEIVDIDSDPALAAEFGEAIPVLFVNGRLFAKTRLPPIAPALRLRRALGIGR
ncbi:MAG: glutaredoxin family protein [Acidobacteriota bacterium]|nr:glutaredoxin family protein [Acidobacteriota bacterium]